MVYLRCNFCTQIVQMWGMNLCVSNTMYNTFGVIEIHHCEVVSVVLRLFKINE